MSKDEIRTYLLATALRGEDPSSLTDELPLVVSGLLDSVATLKLVLFLEERYGITIETSELAHGALDTLSRIVALIEAKQAAQPRP